MAFTLTYAGSEVLVKSGLAGTTVEVGLYNDQQDGGDDIHPSDGVEDITTEPDDYDRVTLTLEEEDFEQIDNAWWGIERVEQFDTSHENTLGEVDGIFILADMTEDGTFETLLGTGKLEREKTDFLDLLFVDRVDIDAVFSIEGSFEA